MFAVDGIPKRDGGDDQVRAPGPVMPGSQGAIADLPEPVEEHGARQRVPRLARIEIGADPPSQGRVFDPLQHEQGSFHYVDSARRRRASSGADKTELAQD